MSQPAHADDVLVRVAELRAAGRRDEAAILLSEALRHDDRAHAVRYELALIEAERGNWAAAENLARSATESGGHQYARGLGLILAKSGKVDEAEEWLRRALALNPKDARAYANLGAVYADQWKLDEALTCIDQALSIQPDYPWAQRCREQLLVDLNFLRDVRATYMKFAQGRGIPDPGAAEQAEIEFPSASVDTNGGSRFVMQLPASLICSDLGAAHLFYREVAGNGFEFALRRFLDLELMSDDVFIDVGAHWGVHSLTAATRWPKQVSVLAIEAHPDNCVRLRNWVQRNRLGDEVEVIPSAIGDREGVAQMRVNVSSMGHTLSTHASEVRIDIAYLKGRVIDVGVTTLDRVLDERAHLRWRRIILKIDVEGYELEVLSGARQLFSTGHVIAVIWEKSAFHERVVQDQRTKAIFDFLNSYGFEHFYFENENVGGPLIPLRGTDVTCNVYSFAPSFNGVHRTIIEPSRS